MEQTLPVNHDTKFGSQIPKSWHTQNKGGETI